MELHRTHTGRLEQRIDELEVRISNLERMDLSTDSLDRPTN